MEIWELFTSHSMKRIEIHSLEYIVLDYSWSYCFKHHTIVKPSMSDSQAELQACNERGWKTQDPNSSAPTFVAFTEFPWDPSVSA